MAGINNNTLLYLRGDSFKDLSPKSNEIENYGVTISNNKLSFNGNSYLQSNISIDYSNPFTVGCWMNISSNGKEVPAVFGAGNSSNSIYENIECYIACGEKSINLQIGRRGTQTTKTVDFSPYFDKLTYLCIVFDGNDFKLFLNGKLCLTIQKPSDYSVNNDAKLRIGKIRDNSFYLNGYISDFIVYDKAVYTEDFPPPNKTYNSININVTNQDENKINFNISKLGQETINKVEVLVNNIISKTYNNIGDLTYNIDNDLCYLGDNNITIRVTYDDNYVEEEILTHNYRLNKLSDSSKLKDIMDRYELLNSETEKMNKKLAAILISKNIEVKEDEYKLGTLIDKVDLLEEKTYPLYLYNEGDECIGITGGWVLNTITTSSYGKIQLEKNETYMKLIAPSGNTSGTTSRGFVITSNYINVTNYNKLKLEVLANINGTQAHNRLVFEVKNSSDTTLTKKEYNSYTNERTTEILDLSTITENVTVQVYLDADGTSSNPKHYIEIYKIWLEE